MKPGVKMIRIPEGLAPETFIGGGCGLVTALHAIDRADIRLDQSVVVLGAGPVGQSIAALARLSGAGEVIVIGAPDDRLAYARRMGASATIGLGTTIATARPPSPRLRRVHRSFAEVERPEGATATTDRLQDGSTRYAA